MKIALAGLAKSGTTALTYTLAGPLPDCRIVFEPATARAFAHAGGNLVVKFLLSGSNAEALVAAVAGFDRRICIVRDPRDQFVSRMLYNWYVPNDRQRDYETFRRLLLAKERAPGAVDFCTLADCCVPLDWFLGRLQQGDDWVRRLTAQGWFRYRYEDMVSGDWTGLAAYIGAPLDPRTEVDPKHHRVVRSKGAGNWRHWFTGRDVDRLRPLMQSILAHQGYDDDWELAEPQLLDPATGSRFVASLRGNPAERFYRSLRQRMKFRRG